MTGSAISGICHSLRHQWGRGIAGDVRPTPDWLKISLKIPAIPILDEISRAAVVHQFDAEVIRGERRGKAHFVATSFSVPIASDLWWFRGNPVGRRTAQLQPEPRRKCQPSNLQDIVVPSDPLVEHRIDEESKQQARDQSRHNDDGEGPLRIGADAVRESGGQQAEACDQGRHHDRPQA